MTYTSPSPEAVLSTEMLRGVLSWPSPFPATPALQTSLAGGPGAHTSKTAPPFVLVITPDLPLEATTAVAVACWAVGSEGIGSEAR
jgi:hypothetical protein